MAFQWRNNEITALIDVWGQQEYQEMLETVRKNVEVYDGISCELNQMFPTREDPFTATKCRSKIKSLKCLYKKAKENNRTSGNSRSNFRFFEDMDQIIGDRPGTEPCVLLDTSAALDEDDDEHGEGSGVESDVSENDASFEQDVDNQTVKKRKICDDDGANENQPGTSSGNIVHKKVTTATSAATNSGLLVNSKGAEKEDSQSVKRTAVKSVLFTKKKKKDQTLDLMAAFLKMEERSTEQMKKWEMDLKKQEKEEEHKFQEKLRQMDLEQERLRWEREDRRKKEEEDRRALEDQRRKDDRLFQMNMAQFFSSFMRPPMQASVPLPTPAPSFYELPVLHYNQNTSPESSNNDYVTCPTYTSLD